MHVLLNVKNTLELDVYFDMPCYCTCTQSLFFFFLNLIIVCISFAPMLTVPSTLQQSLEIIEIDVKVKKNKLVNTKNNEPKRLINEKKNNYFYVI